jgi:glutamyl-tRNA reductase
MPLFTIGISHHTAPIEIREKVAIARSEYSDRARELCALPGVEEVVILGTCNRTEIYCLSTVEGKQGLVEWIHRINDLSAGDDRLFQHTFNAAKTIRTQSGISDHTVSVAYTAVVLARQIFGDLLSKTVVLVGAGEMVQLCGRYLRDHGIANLLIVNRSRKKAEQLATEMDATALRLDQLGEALPRADILISSTASPEPVIRKADVKTALRKRRHRPMFLVDIAVPRDIDPQISKLKDVYLYTIDDLQQVVDENMEQRTAAARSASNDVDEAVSGFMRWLSGIRAARTLKRIRDQSHDFEQDLTERALRKLEAGQNPADVLEQLAKTLTNKILHLPSKRLREAAENRDYEFLTAADRIFRKEDP